MIRILLEDYNAATYELQSEEPAVSLADVLSLSSDFWMHNSHSNCTADPGIPWKVKEEISQAFLMIQRSNEELVMLKADMLSTIAYWFERGTSIVSILDELKCLREDPSLPEGSKMLVEPYGVRSRVTLPQSCCNVRTVCRTS